MAVEVLRRSPGTLEDKIILLPPSLKAFAALSVCEGLAPACSMATTTASSNPEIALFSICFEIKQAPTDAAKSSIMHDASTYSEEAMGVANMEDVSGERLWLVATQVLEEDLKEEMARCVAMGDTPEPESRFSLKRRVGSVGCMLACARTLKGLTVTLPANMRIVFSPTSGAVHVKDVTFQGSHFHLRAMHFSS